MNIKCKAGTEFLTINVVGDSEHLNPFEFNIEQIKCIREYPNKSHNDNTKLWSIVIGNKVYATKDLDFDNVMVGDTVEIGSTMFECCVTTSLTERAKYKSLINHKKHTLYIRKYLKNNNKNDSNNSENLDNFAIITNDERIVPIVK